MAEAYPAFDLNNNRTPGSGSGPMGGPGAFAPGNTPVIYGKNQSPLEGFMQAIGVSKVENGQAYGTTGGAVHMWDSERQGFQALAAAQQEQEAKQRQAQGGQQGQAQQTQQTQNTFLPGAPTATGDVRFNGLTPAGVAGINSEGIPVGSTGGTTFMWSDQVKAANEAAGGDVLGSMGRMNNQFLQPRQPQQPAPMAGNAFLNPTTDVRVNGLTPAAPGGTPLLGRDYGSVNAASGGSGASSNLPSTPLSTFGQRLLATGGTETRDGAVFSGAGGKLSITQDPSTVPARGAGPSNLSPGAMAIITRGANDFKGEGATGQMLEAIGAGAYDEKPMDSATPEQIAALSLRNQQLRQEATNAIPRMMLPNTGNPGVDSQRMNTFLPMAGGALGNVNDMASRAVRNQPEVVTLGGVQYARLGNSMNPIPDRNAPQKQLVAGVTRKLTLPGGAVIDAEWDGRDWIDAKSGAQVYIAPRDSMGYVTGNPTVNPLITGGAQADDPLDKIPGGDDKAAAKPKLTPEQAKAELERRRANKKQGK